MFPPHLQRIRGTNAQNWIASAILGCGPGIYLAITGLGAGAGQPKSARFSEIQNCLGNGVFGLAAFFAPLLLRYINVRTFLVVGPTGYAAYIIGLMYFQAEDKLVLPLVLGVYFGLGSAAIWTGTTYISMAYSTPATKGHFINNQWIGLACGSLVGSAIAFGSNFKKNKVAGVSYGVLGAWLAIHVAAAIVALFFILPTGRVLSPTGHNIPVGKDIIGHDKSAKDILREIGATFTQPKVLLAAAAMLTSDFWLVFIGSWNSRNFTLRARSLNTLLYWAIQLPTAALLTRLLDRKGWSRRKRGLAGFGVLVTMVCASWFSFLLWQGLRPAGANPVSKVVALDWSDGKAYVEGLLVYLVFGLAYPTYHVVLVYYFGALATEGDRKMSFYAGIFKGLQASGIAIAFGISTTTPNLLTEGACYTGVAIASLVPLGYAFGRYLKEDIAVDSFENERESATSGEQNVVDVELGEKEEYGSKVIPAC